jgi:hypothetical protein
VKVEQTSDPSKPKGRPPAHDDGFYKDNSGNLIFFADSTSAHSDNPDPGNVQAAAGQTKLFYLDTPGSFKLRNISLSSTAPIDSITVVENFQSSVCSKKKADDCSAVVSWYIKVVVSPGGVLDRANSAIGIGSL